MLTPHWGWCDGHGRQRNGSPMPVALVRLKQGYFRRENERAWVSVHNLNEPGDVLYHGPRLKEVVSERKEEKAEQQAKDARKNRRAVKS